MADIAANLVAIQQRIRDAEQQYGRESGSVELLAVSKMHTAELIQQAAAAGQQHFGENYWQEAQAKIHQLQACQLSWHFIGPIQANKTSGIAQHCDWVHSVDRLKIAQRLNDQRPDNMARLNICLQVNISQEASKSGVAVDEVAALAQQIATLPRIALRGLMAIPKAYTDFAQQRQAFRNLRELQQQLQQSGLPLDTLSMGMSNDLEAAVAEGSTMVRVGTAIFGARPKPENTQ